MIVIHLNEPGRWTRYFAHTEQALGRWYGEWQWVGREYNGRWWA